MVSSLPESDSSSVPLFSSADTLKSLEVGPVLGAHADVPAEQQRSVHARREEPYEGDDDDSGKNGKRDLSVLHQHVVHFLNDHGLCDLYWCFVSDENTKH